MHGRPAGFEGTFGYALLAAQIEENRLPSPHALRNKILKHQQLPEGNSNLIDEPSMSHYEKQPRYRKVRCLYPVTEEMRVRHQKENSKPEKKEVMSKGGISAFFAKQQSRPPVEHNLVHWFA
jgi:hypothetical protein